MILQEICSSAPCQTQKPKNHGRMAAAVSKSHGTITRKALIHAGFLSKERYGGAQFFEGKELRFAAKNYKKL